MAKRDYYEVLGVERDVGERELKKAYRALAMQFHPDRNPGDQAAENRFKECAEAYAVLNDQDKRSLYDRFGHAGLEGRGGFADPSDIFSQVQDFFGDFFGGGFGGSRQRHDGPTRGGNVRTVVTLTLADCMTGTEREIDLRHPVPCEPCSGTGAKDAKLTRCETCGGVGRVAQRRAGFVLQTGCPTCHGQGARAEAPCPICQGQGEVIKDRKVKVTIPAGIDEGQQLRLSGKGQAGTRGGPAGDLYVDVRIEPLNGFGRDGYDLVYELMLSYPQAALGAKLMVPSVVEGAEPTEVIVPAGVQPGETVVVRNAGLPRLDGRGLGDLVCVTNIEVPKDLSPRAKELIEQLRETFEG